MNSKNVILISFLAFMLIFSAIAIADSDAANRGNSDNADNRGNAMNGIANPVRIDSDTRREINDQIKERIEQAREAYRVRKENYLDARSDYQERRRELRGQLEDFNSLRQELKEARENQKEEIRAALKDRSRLVLLEQVEATLARLEAIKESDSVPENIDEIIAYFEEKKIELENEDLTKEEIIELSKEIRSHWKVKSQEMQRNIGMKLSNGINGIINKSRTFSARLSALADKLEARGSDVNGLDEGIAQLNSDINVLETQYQALRDAYAEAETQEDAKEILREAHELLKEANKKLLEDFRLMKALIKAAKESDATGEISEETSEELDDAIEESQDEDDEDDEDGEDEGEDDE
ncbi:MAG: hypothetical protein ABIH20_05355 [Candidatus Diapherotrites archaeon]